MGLRSKAAAAMLVLSVGLGFRKASLMILCHPVTHPVIALLDVPRYIKVVEVSIVCV